MFQLPAPVPPGTEQHVSTVFEAWFGLFMAFWVFFGLILLLLPEELTDAVWQIAFPFLPRKK